MKTTEEERVPTKTLAITAAIVIAASYVLQLAFQSQLDYVINGDYVSRVDREDLGLTWLLLAIARIIDLWISGVIAKQLLDGRPDRVIFGWLVGFIVIGFAVIPWSPGGEPGMEFLSLKESFLLRQFVLVGVAGKLLYKRHKPTEE